MQKIYCVAAAVLLVAAAQTAIAAPFNQCLTGLKSEFAKKGVTPATFDRYYPTYDASVLDSLNYQPEFKKPVWDYLSMLVDDERVLDGMKAKARYSATLAQIEQKYGVNRHHILGVWGVESNFGQTLGKKPLFDSLATLSCAGRRQSYFKGEYLSALKIVQNGDIRAADMNGSWAGAFGQTQFMPSTFLRLAQDFDGDGHRDIVNSVPDALASTANFLAKAGYKKGEPWGFEVIKPRGVNSVVSARTNKKPMSYWRAQGYTLPNGRPLPDSLSTAGLFAPTGANGPLFLVGKNFDVFYGYNASESYALAIAQLSDLIAQNNPNGKFVTPYPTDDAGISRRQARQVQQALLNLGYDIGSVDGIIGDGTRHAIMDFQQKRGMTADGRAGQKLYRVLVNK